MFWCCSCTKFPKSVEDVHEINPPFSTTTGDESATVISCFEKFWPHGRNKKIEAASLPEGTDIGVIHQWTESNLPTWVVTRSSSCSKLSPNPSVKNKLSRGNAITQRFLFAHEKLLQKVSITSPIVMKTSEDVNNNQEKVFLRSLCHHQSDICLKKHQSCTAPEDAAVNLITSSLPQILWVLFNLLKTFA